jgi:hypothetical protein
MPARRVRTLSLNPTPNAPQALILELPTLELPTLERPALAAGVPRRP